METLAGINVDTVVSELFEENCYLAWFPQRKDCLVFDPGLEPDKILDTLDFHKLKPAAILNTHGHSDHIAGNALLKRRWPDCPLVIGRGDAPKLSNPQLNLSAPFGIELRSPPADILLDEGNTYSAAGFELEVHEIPGHSIGHVVFVWKGGSPFIVFGGDVLFAGSVGRTDLPDGSFRDLSSGIERHLFSLPDDTLVLPGHGPMTTVGREKKYNPFVGGRGESADTFFRG